MASKDNQGEGNKAADRRYREGVKKTVEDTTEKERAAKARNLSPKEQAAGKRAEAEGKAKARV
jgi:hypothetical protein